MTGQSRKHCGLSTVENAETLKSHKLVRCKFACCGFTPYKRLMSILVVLAFAMTLTACEGRIPQVKHIVADTPIPDLTAKKEQHIRDKIMAAIARADSTKDPNTLDNRLAGPELTIRSSQLAIAKSTGKMDPRMTIPKSISQTVIPTDDGWPRTVFTITTTTNDQQSRRLLVLKQQSAHSNYQLFSVARLFQGAKLPKFAVPSIGAQMGTLEDTGLVATPKKAIEYYIDSLNNGAKSKNNNMLAPDFFRQDLESLSQAVQKGIERNHGGQQQIFTPNFQNVSIMRSADGGDLVVVQIDSQWVRKAGDGGYLSLPASDAERVLFGKTRPTSTIRVSYVNVIALYVPQAGSNGKITAVGAERQPVKVEAI